MYRDENPPQEKGLTPMGVKDTPGSNWVNEAGAVATEALARACSGMHPQALELLNEVNTRFGGAGLTVAMAVWAETHLSHATAGLSKLPTFRGLRMAAHAGLSNPAHPGKEPPAEVAWAHSYLLCMGRCDTDGAGALVAQLSSLSPQEKGARVVATLMLVKNTVTALPVGYGIHLCY